MSIRTFVTKRCPKSLYILFILIFLEKFAKIIRIWIWSRIKMLWKALLICLLYFLFFWPYMKIQIQCCGSRAFWSWYLINDQWSMILVAFCYTWIWAANKVLMQIKEFHPCFTLFFYHILPTEFAYLCIHQTLLNAIYL